MENADGQEDVKVNFLMDDISRSYFTAELNVLYWSKLCLRYYAWDRWIKRLLVITSSTAVLSGIEGLSKTVGWTYLAEIVKPLWSIASITSAVFASALLVSGWTRKIQSATRLTGMWSEIKEQYHTLLLDTPDLLYSEVKEQYKSIREGELSASTDALDLPNDKRCLKKKCYKKVLKSSSLTDEQVGG